VRRSALVHAALFAIGLIGFGLLAWNRLGTQSPAPHFVFQADAWLHGTVKVSPPLPNDDWAQVETVKLADGRVVRGRRMVTRPLFRTTTGEEIKRELVKQSVTWEAYVSFPPVPALIMLPGAIISGRAANDVIPTVVFAALALPLCFLVLRRLAATGLSQRTEREDLWLVATLAFGSVFFFSAVQGKVWYTAHVVGVVLALTYAWASIEGARPVVAGIALGLAALTRTPMAFMFPLFVLELWRVTPGVGAERRRAMIKPLVRFAIPIIALACVGMAYNFIRFDSFTEFGHSYLALGDHRPVRQQTQIEQYGLAHIHYLSRNLAAAFALLPDVVAKAPWFQISGHGLAMWFTTPLLLFVVWPRDKPSIHRALWITVALVAAPTLLYMNSGWVQFGYRFALDYLPFLIMLIAIGGRPLGKLGKALIVFGIVVNLFGAWSFDREWRYYKVGGNAYEVVIPH